MRLWVCLIAVLAFGSNLVAQASPARISKCRAISGGERLVGWGKHGLHFIVPKKAFKVQAGKADVDYVNYVIRPKRNEKDVLIFWFGGLALSPGLDKRRNNDLSIAKVEVLDEKGNAIGVDYQGSNANVSRWRKFVVVHEGAVYENVTPASAKLFDEIINSACYIP